MDAPSPIVKVHTTLITLWTAVYAAAVLHPLRSKDSCSDFRFIEADFHKRQYKLVII